MAAWLPLCSINQRCPHSDRLHDWAGYRPGGIPVRSPYVCTIPNCGCETT